MHLSQISEDRVEKMKDALKVGLDQAFASALEDYRPGQPPAKK